MDERNDREHPSHDEGVRIIGSGRAGSPAGPAAAGSNREPDVRGGPSEPVTSEPRRLPEPDDAARPTVFDELADEEAPGREGGYPGGAEPTGERPITLEGHALPHWTDPPTGDVPRIRAHDEEDEEDDLAAWQALGSSGLRWRDGAEDWDDVEELESLGSEETRVGALDTSRAEHSDLYSFDEDFERLEARRRGGATQGGGEPDPSPTGSFAAAAEHPETGGEPHAAPHPPAADVRQPAPGDQPATARAVRAGSPPPAFEEARAASAPRPPRADTRSAASAPPPPRRASGAAAGGRPPRPGGAAGRPEAPTGGGGDVGTRVAVGAAMVVLLLIFYFIGSAALMVVSAILVGVAAAEGFGMLQRAGFRPATLLGLVAAVAIIPAAYWRGVEALPLVVAFTFAGSMLWYLLGIVEARPLANIAVTNLMFLWVGLLGSFGALMLRAHDGRGLFFGAVIVAVGADVAAFFTGSRLGNRTMAPRVSPGKTWEGAAAGLVAALILGAIIGKAIDPWGGMKHGLIFGLLVGIIGPIGDLSESMIKRDLGIKDSGSILPGHGGLLDRVDAILFVLPLAYYLSLWAGILKV